MAQENDDELAEKYQKLARDYMDIWQEEWGAICAAKEGNIMKQMSDLTPVRGGDDRGDREEAYKVMLEMQQKWLLQMSDIFKVKKGGS